MPNHIDNVLTIVGPDADVRAFVDKAHGTRPKPPPTNYDLERWQREHGGEPYPKESEPDVLEFHAIVPLPKEYGEVPYSHPSSGDYHSPNCGYNMERLTWGVKWGAYQTAEPTVSEGRATYAFQTAWSCPRLWLEKASVGWPTLTFVCSYGGEGPARGRCVFRNGEALRDRSDEYDEADYPNEDDFPDEDERHEAYKRAEHELIRQHPEFVEETMRTA